MPCAHGGIAGYPPDGSITNSYFLTGTAAAGVGNTVTEDDNNPAKSDTRPKTKSEFAGGDVLARLKQNDTTDAWDNDGYLAAAGMTLPLLKGQTADAHTHTYTGSYSHDETHHWQECACGAPNKESHTGGTATCTAKAKCTVCDEEYGNPKPHDYSTKWSTDDTKHWHKCTDCDAITDEAKHNDTNKDHNCDLCGKAMSTCSGGTATCKEQAKCDVCGAEHGELDADNHTDLKHIDAKAATKAAEGNIEYWNCADCGKYFADKDGAKVIAKADTVTAKLPEEKPTEDKSAETNPTSPKTGDSNNLPLWFALLFISGGAVTVTTVVSKKKKHS